MNWWWWCRPLPQKLWAWLRQTRKRTSFDWKREFWRNLADETGLKKSRRPQWPKKQGWWRILHLERWNHAAARLSTKGHETKVSSKLSYKHQSYAIISNIVHTLDINRRALKSDCEEQKNRTFRAPSWLLVAGHWNHLYACGNGSQYALQASISKPFILLFSISPSNETSNRLDGACLLPSISITVQKHFRPGPIANLKLTVEKMRFLNSSRTLRSPHWKPFSKWQIMILLDTTKMRVPSRNFSPDAGNFEWLVSMYSYHFSTRGNEWLFFKLQKTVFETEELIKSMMAIVSVEGLQREKLRETETENPLTG